MFNRLSVKLTAYIVLTLILISSIFVPVYTVVQKSLYLDLEDKKMQNFANEMIKYSFKSDEIASYIEDNNSSDYVIFIRNEKFKLIYSTKRYGEFEKYYRRVPLEDEVKNELISQYLKGAVPEHYFSEDDNHEKIVLRKCIEKDNKTYYIYIRESLRAIDSFFDFSNGILIEILIAYMIVCSLVLFVLISGVTRSVRKLSSVTEKIAQRDYTVRYDGKISNDEIGNLSKNINEMADTIQENISSLDNYNFLLKEDLNYMSEYESMRNRVICNVTHELKTPLAIISSQIEMMKFSSDEKKRDFYYSSAMEEIDKMSKLISRFLNYSVRDKDIFKGEVKKTDLSKSIRKLCQKSESYVSSKKIRLVTNIEDDCNLVLASNHVEHVFNNYLNNAIHHTRKYGEIRVKLKKHNGKIRLSVYNDGNTIDDEFKDNIWFESFTSNKNISDSNMHVGLGLFIVKEISVIDHTECGFINHKNGVEFWFDFIGS